MAPITFRDGHTRWVMDIQPYPIQMFWVIPDSSWVEINQVGYGYYPNCSDRVWILSKPDPLKKKKKKKKQEEWLHIVVLVLVFQSGNYVPITLVQE